MQPNSFRSNDGDSRWHRTTADNAIALGKRTTLKAMIILVTGATGTIRSELVKQLLASEVNIRALTRDRDRAGFVSDRDVEVVEGDFREPPTLDAALNNAETAFLLSPVVEGIVQLQGNFIEAAQRAGIQHLVNLSAAGADPDSPGLIARWHGEIEKHVEDSGLRYTHLRPVSYMQNLLEQADSIRVDGVVAQAIPQDAPINMIDTRDIAVVAATVLTENGHEGKKYKLTGPEVLTYAQIVETLSEVTGTEITYRELSPEAAKQRLLDQGRPE